MRDPSEAATFDLSAGQYDRVGPRFFTATGHRLASAAQIQPGMDVMEEVATGAGAVLQALILDGCAAGDSCASESQQ
jgi:hypothetical protein